MAYDVVNNMLSVTQRQLQDETGADWTQTVLLPYLNQAIIEIVNLVPDAYSQTADISLSAGAIQTIGTTYLALIDVICNITGTSTIGKPLRFIDRKELTRRRPNWMLDTASNEGRFVMRADGDDRQFFIYPAQTGSPGKARVIVSALPTEISNLASTFPLDKKFIPAAINYVIYRALIEETTIPNAQAKAGTFLAAFYQSLGLTDKAGEKTRETGK